MPTGIYPKEYRNYGKKHPQWKGDNVGYRAIHHWIEKYFGKASKCEKCKILNLSRYHWANISGKYKRNITDWLQLCPSCHKLLDKGNKCVNGHEFTKENTCLYLPKGRRNTIRLCRKCRLETSKIWKRKKRLLDKIKKI